jgi:hypothetical protein
MITFLATVTVNVESGVAFRTSGAVPATVIVDAVTLMTRNHFALFAASAKPVSLIMSPRRTPCVSHEPAAATIVVVVVVTDVIVACVMSVDTVNVPRRAASMSASNEPTESSDEYPALEEREPCRPRVVMAVAPDLLRIDVLLVELERLRRFDAKACRACAAGRRADPRLHLEGDEDV